MRFLVVEDHDFQRRSLSRMLQRLGAGEVVEADGGAAALEALDGRSAPPDVIISDLTDPTESGPSFKLFTK